MANKLKLNVKFTRRTIIRPFDQKVFLEKLMLIVGEPGLRTMKSKQNQPRRFLMVRGKTGYCKYYYWTQPLRGEECKVVLSSRLIQLLSAEKVNEHFKLEE